MSRNTNIQKFAEFSKTLDKIPMPTDYDIERAKIAALTCRSPSEFAKFMDIDLTVIKYWCHMSKAFKEAYGTWKEHVTTEVERSLAKKATGFTKITRKQVMTRQGQVVDLVNEEYFPPDVAAATFWLKNRAPEDWQDKKEIDVNMTANIRAWLVEAEASSNIIDVTPTLIEDQDED